MQHLFVSSLAVNNKMVSLMQSMSLAAPKLSSHTSFGLSFKRAPTAKSSYPSQPLCSFLTFALICCRFSLYCIVAMRVSSINFCCCTACLVISIICSGVSFCALAVAITLLVFLERAARCSFNGRISLCIVDFSGRRNSEREKC